ncbi:DUF4880 domain-containing protein [Caulobacter sp. CCNWLY153]|uniref:FecR N-terminal domain-containing protein n=1 Tax=Caulobacter radicis TaxID=2172650 RepID=A0A2T9J3E4_9CAUL|nr:DUF4880 domain-containing protein [Caulobacter radicis]PVM74909.1 hypothetical protein DDF65_18915 [Caulobacter radicis]
MTRTEDDLREAAAWLDRLRSPQAGEGDREEFETWVAHPRRRDAFEAVSAVDAEIASWDPPAASAWRELKVLAIGGAGLAAAALAAVSLLAH